MENGPDKAVPSVGPRATRGVAWTLGLTVTERTVNIIKTIILARLLSPKDFGLMGVAVLSLGILETFSKTGFEAALIHKRQEFIKYLDTAWTVEILRASALSAMLILSAPLVAAFFDEPSAVAVVRVCALLILLRVLVNPMVVALRKDLRYRQLSILRLTGHLVGAVVTVSMAFITRNVWALVSGSLAAAATTLLVSYIILPYRPRLSLELSKAKELFGYGKWVLASFVLLFLLTQGDDILVGKLLGVVMLGYYQMAYKISQAPVTHFTHTLFNVLFPAYTKLKDDLPRLKEAYLEVFKLTSLATIPLMYAAMFLAEDFVRCILGERWLPIVAAVRVLCVAGVLKAISETASAVFYALGKPRIDTKWKIAQLLAMVLFIVPLILKLQLLGAAIGVLISTLPPLIGHFRALMKEIDLTVSAVLKALLLPLVGSTVMSLFVIVAGRASFYPSPCVRLGVLALIGSVSYLGSILVLDSLTSSGIRKLVTRRMAHIVGK